LLAENEVFTGGASEQVREQLKKDVAAAREAHPKLIAIRQPEIDLLPNNAFAERMRLADEAVQLGPDNPLGYSARAGVELAIGRMADAIDDAQKAVTLDPLSPTLRDYYIQALQYGGRIDVALDELAKAERLWPGATNLKFARFRINLRYGDASEALRAIRSDPSVGWTGAESYLEARIDPSPAKIERAIDDTLRFYRRYPEVISHLAQVYGEFGREKDLLELLLKAPEADVIYVTDVMFRPTLAEFWMDPRSLLFARRAGLLQFWQSSGKWPDFCNARDLPYDCKKRGGQAARA
jgi:tetratricopeptide (TPR) repeat protein